MIHGYIDNSSKRNTFISVLFEHNGSLQSNNLSSKVKQLYSEQIGLTIGSSDSRSILIIHFNSCRGISCSCLNHIDSFLSIGTHKKEDNNTYNSIGNDDLSGSYLIVKNDGDKMTSIARYGKNASIMNNVLDKGSYDIR